jgi:7,8-dihydropterin-6-yl-methyl-4-(beta-D-ribofuranosyl)aminobenzene 5'-phosphate synthase
MSLLRIITLNENKAQIKGNLIAEWGLSFLLETKKVTILFDTGKNISVCYNAQLLGIDLNEIDKIVLSHSHSDHTGGLRQILERMNKKREVEVIAHPDIWKTRYNRYDNKPDKYMGMPFQQKELERLGACFRLTNKSIKITDGMVTSGEIPLITDYEKVKSKNTKRLILEDGNYQEDEILDDQAIFFKTGQGLIIITGCAHRGIINTLYYARKITGIDQIYAVIGGTHLIEASKERINQTIDALQELNIKKIGLCHCTGLPAVSLLLQKFPNQFININSGTVLEF